MRGRVSWTHRYPFTDPLHALVSRQRPLKDPFMLLPRFFLASVTLGATLAVPAQAQSLSQLLDQARGYDAAWQSARAQLDASTSRANQARAGLLPSAALSAGVSRANTDISTSAPVPPNASQTTQTLGINAAQPLYRPANRITLQQGLRGIDVAQAQLDGATQDLLVRVSQAYFDVLAAQDTLTFVQAQKAATSEQLAAAKRNFEVGTTTITGTTGAKPLPLALPVLLPSVQPNSVADWVLRAQDSQPLVRQAAIAVDVAELETRKAETGHLPTVDLQAGYNIQRSPNGTQQLPGFNTRANSASVGVALNLPLFTGFAVQNRVKETLALEEKARADLENLRRSVAQNTRAAFYGVQSGLGQVQALEAAEASSQSALEANQLGYQVGVRINIDVLNAQSQLFQTKRDLAQARYNVLLGTLKLPRNAYWAVVDSY